MMYHAYDYAWRKWMLGETETNSPMDPDRSWYDPILVASAERMWRGDPAQTETMAWEAASRWFSQPDRSNVDVYRSVVVRRGGADYRFVRTPDRNIVLNSIIHQGPQPYTPTGAPSADDVAHAEVMANLARAGIQAAIEKFNSKHAGDRRQSRFVEDKADLEALQRKLSLKATERK